MYNNYILLSVFMLLNTHLSFSLSLKDIYFYQGNITDKLVLYFDKRPGYLTEPASSEGNYIKLNMLVPYARVSNPKVLSKMLVNNKIDKPKDGYSFSIDKTAKGVPGLNVLIEYDPKKVKFNYKSEIEKLDNNLYALVLSFSSIKNLNIIQDKDSPLRWLAMGKHIPRVVLDIRSQSDSGLEINRVIKKIKKLGKNLNKKCELFCLSVKDFKNVSEESLVSAVNLIYKPDFYIILERSLDSNNSIFYPKNSLIVKRLNKSKNLAYLFQHCLELKLGSKFNIHSSNLAKNFNLAAAEMPCVYISFDDKLYKKIYNNISGIICKCINVS